MRKRADPDLSTKPAPSSDPLPAGLESVADKHSRVYNLEKPGEWKSIVDLLFIAAMVQPGGGKNDIPGRLKRHFAILNVTMPSMTAIDNIYGAMLRGRFYNQGHGPKPVSTEVAEAATRLTDMTIMLWQKVAARQ